MFFLLGASGTIETGTFQNLSVVVFAGVGLRLIGGAVLGMQLQLKDRKLA